MNEYSPTPAPAPAEPEKTPAQESKPQADEPEASTMGLNSGIAPIANRTANFKFYLENATVEAKGDSAFPSDWKRTNNTDGTVVFTSSNWSGNGLGVIFTVTPNPGYLITSAYYINKYSTANAGIASDNGSVQFPYHDQNTNQDVEHHVTAYKPTVNVTITSDARDVQAGDTVKLTVTVTPDSSEKLNGFNKNIQSVTVTIGGESYNVTVDANGQGTLDYTVQESDIGNKVTASVSAAVHYSGTVQVAVNGSNVGSFSSNVTVTSTANTSFSVLVPTPTPAPTPTPTPEPTPTPTPEPTEEPEPTPTPVPTPTRDPSWRSGLKVTKEADKDEYHVGDTITYTITVENVLGSAWWDGGHPIQNVTVVDETFGETIDFGVLDNDNESLNSWWLGGNGITTKSQKIYHLVTEEDLEAGYFSNGVLRNVVTATGEYSGEWGTSRTEYYNDVAYEDVTIIPPETYTLDYAYTGVVPDGASELLPPAAQHKDYEEVPVASGLGSLKAYDENGIYAGTYTFDGWYTDADCTQKADGTIKLSGDTTLYGQWSFKEAELPPVPGDYGPEFEASKTADKTVYHVGDTIIYTISVTNTRPYGMQSVSYPYHGVTVYDDLLGLKFDVGDLPCETTWSKTIEYKVTEETLKSDFYVNGTLRNIVSAYGTCNETHTDVGASAYVDVKIIPYGVTYEWSGLPETGEDLPQLPVDNRDYNIGDLVTPDTTYHAGSTYEVYDGATLIERYTFSGWSPSSKTMTKDGAKFTGTWTKEEFHKVNYSVITPEPEGVTNSPQTLVELPASYAQGDHYIVKDYPEGVETPEGTWTFDGWYLNGKKVNPGDELTMGDADVSITGAWKFTYHDDALKAAVKAPESITFGEDLGDPTSGVTLNDKEFNGYGEPKYTYYKDGEEVTDLQDGKPWRAGTYTVKATWDAVPEKNLPPQEAESDSFQISPKALTFNAVKVEEYNNGEEITANFTAGSATSYQDSLRPGDHLSLNKTLTGTGAENDVTKTEASVTECKVYADADETIDVTDCYVITANVTLLIVDASLTVPPEVIYGEDYKAQASVANEKLAEYGHQYGDAVLTYKDSDGNVIDKPVNAGTYSVTASWAGDDFLPPLEKTAPFTITQRPITIHKTASETYTGSDITMYITGEDISADTPLAYNDQLTLNASITGKEVNRYTEVKGQESLSITNGERDVRGNYDVTITGILDITPKAIEITIKGETLEKTYDGNTYTIDKYTTEGIPEGADIVVTMTDDITVSASEAGNHPQVLNGHFNVTSKNYEVTVNYEDGALVISKAVLTVTPVDNHKVYGENDPELTYTVTGLVKDETAEDAGLGEVTLTRDEGEDVDKYPITADGSEDLKNYTVDYKTGEFEITPAALTVTPANSEKIYGAADPDPLTTYTVEGLTNGDTEESLALNVVLDREDGEEEGNYTITTDGNRDLKNYTVDYQTAIFTIQPKAITDFDVAQLGNVVYNGASQPQEPAVTDGAEELVKDTDYELSYTEDTTNVGTVTVTVSGIGNYTGSVTRTYAITPAPLTVTTEGATKVYDGTELTNRTANIQGLVANETASIAGTGAITNVGTTANTYAITWGTAKQSNYQVVAEDLGTLEVTAAPATAMTVDTPVSTMYDGAAHQWIPTVTGVGGAALTAGVDYSVSYSTADFTNAGSITGTVTGMGNYSGSVSRTYQITPRAVTMTSGSGNRAYNGQPLTNHNVALGGDGFVSGEGASYNVTGTQTAAGSSQNGFTYTLNANTLAGNYSITQAYGTLTVTAAPVTAMTVNAPANLMYDGAARQWAPTVTGVGGATLRANRDYTVRYSTNNFTDAGTINVTITGRGNYSGSVNRTYQITPRTVTLASPTATRAYNGAALTATAINVRGNGFVRGEGATFNVTGTQTAVGTSRNTFTYALRNGTKAGNYNITVTTGTLTVTPAALAVNTPANTTYDGAVHQWAPTVTGVGGTTLRAGVDYNVTYSTGNFTDAGTITATITGIGNYTGTVTRTYQITPRLVILTSASATKAYDGAALRANDVTVTGAGFVRGEGATYNVTGQRTAVGSARNTFTYTLNPGTDAGNYNIMQAYGTLTITNAVPEPDDNEPVDIPDDEVPMDDTPDDLPDEPEDLPEEPEDLPDEGEPVDIPDDEVPMDDLPDNLPEEPEDLPDGLRDDVTPDDDYILDEEVVIEEDDTPLTGGPSEQVCCILHFILMLGALLVAVYYTYDRKKRQEREFELRSELQ